MANVAGGSAGSYSYSQLEQFWEQAGGSKSLAPVMAAIALAESGGNPLATNRTDNNGTQTSWGLWQISNGTHTAPAANWSNPVENARLAVQKYNSQGLSAWGTYDSGAYKQFLHGGSVPPGANISGGKTSPAQQAQLTSFLSGASNALSGAGALVHGVAIMIDRAVGLFSPGQGWRIVFGAGALAAGSGSFLAFRSSFASGDGDDGGIGGMPLGVLLAGVAATGAFIAFRPWPQASGAPIKPGAYVVDVLRGEPPPAGPATFSPAEVQLTEAGLMTLLALWAAGKAGQGVSAITGAVAGGAAAGGLIGKFWNMVKGMASGGEAAAGEAAAAGDIPVA